MIFPSFFKLKLYSLSLMINKLKKYSKNFLANQMSNHFMQRKIGLTRKQCSCNGPLENTALTRVRIQTNLTKTIGLRQLVSFQEETTRNVFISLTKLELRQFRKAIGLKKKTRNLFNLLEPMESNNGVSLQLN